MGNLIRNIVVGLLIFVVLIMALGFVSSKVQGTPGLGALGSTHVHADFLVYIDNNPIDFNQQKYFVRSSFVHVEPDTVGGAGKVIHIHATGVPVGMFFESLNMKLAKDCFKLDSGEQYCNSGNKKLRFYVNGKLNEQYGDYVFVSGDKILISYGDYTDEQLQEQLLRIPDFAKLQ